MAPLFLSSGNLSHPRNEYSEVKCLHKRWFSEQEERKDANDGNALHPHNSSTKRRDHCRGTARILGELRRLKGISTSAENP
jgi:hypothetical protein